MTHRTDCSDLSSSGWPPIAVSDQLDELEQEASFHDSLSSLNLDFNESCSSIGSLQDSFRDFKTVPVTPRFFLLNVDGHEQAKRRRRAAAKKGYRNPSNKQAKSKETADDIMESLNQFNLNTIPRKLDMSSGSKFFSVHADGHSKKNIFSSRC